MIPTKEYIEQKFAEYNNLMFGGKLAPLPIRLGNAKSYLGLCTYKKQRVLFGKPRFYDFKLRFNTRYDLPEDILEDTIIHEMIHYYILSNQMHDTSAHGRIFRQIMHDINARHGRKVTISHRNTQDMTDTSGCQRPKLRNIAVVKFRDGRTGIKVLPNIQARIQYYCRNVLKNPEIESVTLHQSTNPFFGKYPSSAALKVYFLEDNRIQEELGNGKKP